MRIKRLTAALVAGAGLALAAGACGDDQGESNPGQEGTQPAIPMGTNPAVQERLDTTPQEQEPGDVQVDPPGGPQE